MEDLCDILESMGFKEGDMPETWKGVFEGIYIRICIHPFKGIALSFYSTDKRAASEGEIFIPKNSNKRQIAQTFTRIHDTVYGNKIGE
jgi:hypothetical protein